MRTIASPACSSIVAGKTKGRIIWKEHSFSKLGGREVSVFSSKDKHGRVGFLHLIRNNYKGYSPVLASSESQAKVETAETENQPISESKTVRVRFLLQKECAFGEQFLLVGDDPMLGSWDPESAVPLNWSDGHVWVVEMEAAVEKSIQYKFLLRGITGKITWQPEPDRIVQTWDTANTIVVSEDWEDAGLQKIAEEELQDDQNSESIGSSEMLIVAENLTDRKTESVPKIKEISPDVKTTSAAKNPSPESSEKQIVVAEKQVALVADNISHPQKNPAVNSTDGHVAAAEEILGAGKETIPDNGGAPARKSESEDGNKYLFVYEGGPVLVPGLTPLAPPASEAETLDEDESKKSINSDAFLAVDEVKNHNIPETEQPEEETAEMVSDELNLKRETDQALPVAKQGKNEEVPANRPESKVLNNDIRWGRRTLQKLLSNLGFM